MKGSHRASNPVSKGAVKASQIFSSNERVIFGPSSDVQGRRSEEEHHPVENGVF